MGRGQGQSTGEKCNVGLGREKREGLYVSYQLIDAGTLAPDSISPAAFAELEAASATPTGVRPRLCALSSRREGLTIFERTLKRLDGGVLPDPRRDGRREEAQ